MMVNPCDDSRLMLAWQIDHSRVAGYFLRRIGKQRFRSPGAAVSPVKWPARKLFHGNKEEGKWLTIGSSELR